MVGFLDDLFVVPDQRSSGAAAALMAAVKQHAIAANWGVVRWITRDNNYRARGLYDKLAQKTDWALYEMTAK
jgi:GNAT superfamily N-acetyltransferase